MSEDSRWQSQTRASSFAEIIIIIFSVSNVALNYLHKGGTKEREERWKKFLDHARVTAILAPLPKQLKIPGL